MVQAVIVAVLAAVLGSVLSVLIGPLFPIRVIVPMAAFLLLPVRRSSSVCSPASPVCAAR